MEKLQLVGSLLVVKAGGFRAASHELQEINMLSSQTTLNNIRNMKHLFPAVSDQLESFFSIGACPNISDVRERGGKTRGFPHDGSKTQEILKSLWPDIQKGRILVAGVRSIPLDERYEPTPTASVPKRGADRKLTGKTRTISDMRRVNLGLSKYDVYAVTVPQIQEIVEEIIALRRLYHGIRIETCKRDIEAAFKRIYLHPDLVNIACHEFKAEFAYTSDDVLVGFLRSPFGFSGIPGMPQVATDAIKAVHRRTGSSTPERDGDHAFDCHIFADDGIFVEPRLGKRHTMVVEKWEATVRSLLGDDAINEEKKETEGSWSCQNCILGFEANTETMTISSPKEKISMAKEFVQSSVLEPYNYNLNVGDVQKLRGLVQYWKTQICSGRRPFKQSI